MRESNYSWPIQVIPFIICSNVGLLIIFKKNKAYIQAGAGIVADSQPEKEYQETVNKAKAMVRAIEIAEQGLL